MHQSKVSYVVTDNSAVIKLTGELRLFHSGMIEAAYQQIAQYQGKRTICLDLSEAYHVDSTIFGTLAQLCLLQPQDKPLIMYYQHDNVLKQLQVLGIHFLCHVIEGAPDYPGSVQDWNELFEEEAEKEQLKKYVLRAHQTLAKICNYGAMQSVIDELSNDKRNH